MKKYKIVVIGAGFSGLCLGITFKQAGLHDFKIFEKASDLGGTWRENTYPGAECDIPSALYSYSFEHNDKWQYKWSGQQQILKYQHDTTAKYKVGEHIQFNTELTKAEYDETEKHWLLTMQTGEQCLCQHFISAIGQLHHPAIAKFEGEEDFQGSTFHSAQWNHDIDLTGKRVGVIGNAASAVQFIPEIAKQVKHLTIFQRSANWIVPKVDREYTRFEQWVSKQFPLITKVYRFCLWFVAEAVVLPAIKGNRLARWALRTWSLGALKKAVPDTELRAKLVPAYPIGAKRVLFSDNYYPTLARENVALETSGVERFTSNGLLSKDGEEHPFDVVIYGTGFQTNPFLAPMLIVGEGQQSLRDHWSDGAHAYLGITTAGFPNMYMMYGPNTNLGHTSIIIMIEAQAKYILQCVQGLDQRSAQALKVKEPIEQQYNQDLQSRLQEMVFSEVEHSWYMDGGKVTNNWVGGTREYSKRIRNVDWDDYIIS